MERRLRLLLVLGVGAALGLVQTQAQATQLQQCTPWTAYSSDGTNCVTREYKNTCSSSSASSQDVTIRYADGNFDTSTLTGGAAVRINCHVTSIKVRERTHGTTTCRLRPGPSS